MTNKPEILYNRIVAQIGVYIMEEHKEDYNYELKGIIKDFFNAYPQYRKEYLNDK